MKIRNKSNIFFISMFCMTCCYGINTRRSHEDENLEEKSSSITSRKSGPIRFEDTGILGPGEQDHAALNLRFKFEEDTSSYGDSNGEPDHGAFSNRFKFEDDTSSYGDSHAGRITFLDDNKIDFERPGVNQQENKVESSGTKKKKRRRRRPRYQRPPSGIGPYPGPQYPGGLAPGGASYPAIPGVPGAVPPYPAVPGAAPSPYPGIPGSIPPYPGFGFGNPGTYYRPPRRPKPSFASEALTAVTGALSSIAQYDDYQCVPRLLCEAAGGGALGSSGVLQSVAGLQPLLTLLAAYNGISSSPLFVFGRAVFLGMTTKGNTASCRYAYPQCPTDPEQLVYYLNNHNGGFFRFFNTPQQNPQNLQQFYQQLSSQGQYGLPNFSPNPYLQNSPENFNSPNPYPQNPPENFGYFNPYPQNLQQQNFQSYGADPHNQQGYGLQQYPNGSQNHYGLYQPQLNQYQQQNFGLQNPQFQNTPNFYSSNGYGYLQSYGKKYPYTNTLGFKNIKLKDKGDKKQIQRRIQNKPNHESTHDSNIGNIDSDTNFRFPDNHRVEDESSNRGGKVLKFPEETFNNNHLNDKRKEKAIAVSQDFRVPDVNNGYSNRITNAYLNYLNFNIRDMLLDNYFKYYSYYHGHPETVNKQETYNNSDQEQGVRTVYIVRGNGDPNNPEIVQIRPGEEVKL